MDTPTQTPRDASGRFQDAAGDARHAPLATYMDLVIGRRSLAALLRYEFTMACVANLPGLAGLALRRVAFRGLFKACGRGAILGVGLQLYRPSAMTLGRGCCVSDHASLSVRGVSGAIVLDDGAFIGRGSILNARDGEIAIGARSSISSTCRVGIDHGRIAIGEDVLVAAFTYIGGGRHRYDRTDIPITEQSADPRGGVTIGDGAWIGAGAMVMDGVTIGPGAVIGAGAVVTSDIPANAVAMGVPARVVRMRGDATE